VSNPVDSFSSFVTSEMSVEIEMDDLSQSKFDINNQGSEDDVQLDYAISAWAWTCTTLYVHFAWIRINN
jgi:hypothetical protein